ncbi:ribonuclease III [candidate division KSB1 bacterium]|nr:ribonuclease III [candidate division KSB1 bacterium]RQW07314.1 MAG: ribonuclease III [candidate division KSB1 bacterium]
MSLQWFKNLLTKRVDERQTAVVPASLQKLCKKINYTFKDHSILLQALKHRSYLTATGEGRSASNERLELLGDAVLGMVVTEFLYKNFPQETEGILTNYKSLLVSGRLLATVAKEIDLGQYMLLNDSEARSGGRKRNSILADAVESLLGAIYIDGGLEQARSFIYSHVTQRLDSLLRDDHLRNNKSLLQEYCQSLNLDGPFYRVDEESGPDHLKIFTVSAVINGRAVGIGSGTSKKKAEQSAANHALRSMKEDIS